MKKFLSLSLALTLAVTSIFANNEIGQRVMDSFKKEFAQAQDVKWENSRDLSKATFKMNEQVMVAYFTEAGELVAVTRNLTVNQLPINLQSSMKKGTPDAWLTDLFEVSTGDETSYFVTLHNATHVTVMKSVGTQGWTVYKKEKKKAE
ncbi:MAG: hypothetical protein EOO04_00100 [Chitinophagaceae bacterium]|nr:MAG: hypothetical protein EOO04_00100 [Chitinophagaceae bacterium]